MRRVASLVLVCSMALIGCAQLPRAYTPSEPTPRYFLYQDRIRIYYTEAGQGDPLILLHGFGETHATWEKLIPGLAPRHRVISVDLKGAGYSDKPDDGRYHVADQAAIVEALADKMHLQGVTLVGHSLGGGVALMTALQWQLS
ncbi:MAG TPA: alpha/beta fold hydrolase, partial [Nitrospiria bacterium]|nr:alpha/beta fold hydrolase [Nitrospiria bacterium]